MIFRVLVARHGQCPANVGAAPTANGLTHVGEDEATRLASYVEQVCAGRDLIAAASSNALRSRSTLGIILRDSGMAGTVAAEVDDELREQADGETDAQVQARIRRTFADLVAACTQVGMAAERGEADLEGAGPHHLLLISHGQYMSLLLREMEDMGAEMPANLDVQATGLCPNCGVTIIDINVHGQTGAAGIRVREVNRDEHLQAANQFYGWN